MESSVYSREERSRAMFGTKDALDVFGVVLSFEIDPAKEFTASDIKQEFFDQKAINNASIHRNLVKLEGIGAIEPISDENGLAYRRVENPLWELLVRPMLSEAIDNAFED